MSKINSVFDERGIRQRNTLSKLIGTVSSSLMTKHLTLYVPSRRISAAIEIFYGRILLETQLQANNIVANGTDGYFNAAGCVGSIRGQTDELNVQVISGLIQSSYGSGNLHQVLAATNLPFMYEMDSAIRKYDISVTLGPTSFGDGTQGSSVEWFARARFEPNTPMDDVELGKLFSKCSLDVPTP